MARPLSVKFEPNIPLMLRDGTITYVDVFRPDTADKYPALLGRTPYGRPGNPAGTATWTPSGPRRWASRS